MSRLWCAMGATLSFVNDYDPETCPRCDEELSPCDNCGVDYCEHCFGAIDDLYVGWCPRCTG